MELESSKDTRIFDTKFENVDAIIVPGGFDSKGIEGKIKAINYVRNNKIPFLGICLGLQTSVIEFARNVLGKQCANSTEFDVNCDYPIVHFVSGQESIKKKSGTMRLGAYQCDLTKDTLAFDLYKKKTISERHRHRYEVNNSLISDPDFSNNGLIVSGRHPETQLVEMIELKKDVHPFFIATQAHPEFKSRLQFPAPLFSGLINAAKILKQN
jgi:CTP synthase